MVPVHQRKYGTKEPKTVLAHTIQLRREKIITMLHALQISLRALFTRKPTKSLEVLQALSPVDRCI